MVAFVRALSLTAVSVLPATLAAFSLSSSPSCSQFSFRRNSPSKLSDFAIESLNPIRRSSSFAFSAVQMDSPVTQSTDSNKDEILPELMTEFMVDMHCDGCVSAVKKKLDTLDGIKGLEVDLSNQVVRILSSLPVKTMLEALEQTGRTTKLIGQGNPNDFLISAAVAEFKGPLIFGVVRFAQVNMEVARIEANFSGLTSGKHAWSINEFGDLTKGPFSTGQVFNKPLGDLGTLEVGETGEVQFSGSKEKLKVSDLIGRSVVLYETGEVQLDKRIAASVVARSAGVGENYKKLCTCDGVTIWESS